MDCAIGRLAHSEVPQGDEVKKSDFEKRKEEIPSSSRRSLLGS